MYVCMYVRTYVCMYVRMYVCTYVYMNISYVQVLEYHLVCCIRVFVCYIRVLIHVIACKNCIGQI